MLYVTIARKGISISRLTSSLRRYSRRGIKIEKYGPFKNERAAREWSSARGIDIYNPTIGPLQNGSAYYDIVKRHWCTAE